MDLWVELRYIIEREKWVSGSGNSALEPECMDIRSRDVRT